MIDAQSSVGHYENFPVASVLLPQRFRWPVTVIYRFAREADDFADEGDLPAEQRLALLAGFQAELDALEAGRASASPLFQDLATVVAQYRLPVQLLRDLLDAFAQDVVKTRYADFSELLDYCRRSADPVGRLLLHLFERATPANLAMSDQICSALQLINFWQDVAVDWQKDRVYLPQDDLRRFGVDEAQIAAGRVDEPWRALMAFQVERAQEMLRAGKPLGRALPGRMGLEIRAIVAGGQTILNKLRGVRGDVFHQRPVLRPWDAPRLLLHALW